ncbi:hypothetical protein [Urbifossiella limnaea]|uniref:Glycosyltransferase RgtA/B/C/D-like domain-containing protein n=1 Tax=Urbifossiella limnaea TaxID=2528023 RepID=A0A517XNT0_9BACT|nr:hypothetical protein [Urbifossiella limnaea]QDU19136.1 hypothetical protein ETAA1_10400 [Urbifossiella limnaea]
MRLGVYAALLYVSWNHNLLGLPDRIGWSRDGVRAGALGSEANLVAARVARPDLPALHPLILVGPGDHWQPYTSQVGLTGIVVAAVPLPPEWVVPAAAAAMALAAAAVVAAVLVGGQRWLGPPAGDIGCALAAASPAFLPVAPSLYWALGLMLLPFALVWCLAPRAAGRGRCALLAAAVALAVLAKCLCGYEYVTTVVLAPVAAAWFHLHRAAAPLGRRVATAVVVTVAGLAGFAGALGLHVAQHQFVMGTDGVAAIRDRATARTVADPTAEAGASGSRVRVAARCFWGFFEQPAVSVAGGFGRVRADVPLKWVAGAALALAAAAGLARARLPRAAVGLAGAVVLGLAAGVSWQVLAVNHMCVHDHLNRVVFVVPFLPLAFLAVGTAVGLLARWAGPAALVLVGVTMAVNLATAPGRAADDDADQRAAEAAVADVLKAPRPADARVSGVVDSALPAGAVPTSNLADFGWLDLRTGAAADPGALVVQGWVAGGPLRATRPATRVVAVVGDRVVPCDQLRFRRRDVEAALGRPVPGAGYVVRVPAAALATGGALRLFGVGPDGAVTELTAAAGAPATPPAAP